MDMRHHFLLRFEYSVDMRYWGQSFELNIPAPETSKIDTNWLNQLLESFHKTHEISYGFRVDNDPIEIVNLRLTTIRKISQPKIKKLLKQKIDSSYAMKGIRPVYFGSNNEKDQTPVYNRKNLSPKNYKINNFSNKKFMKRHRSKKNYNYHSKNRKNNFEHKKSVNY